MRLALCYTISLSWCSVNDEGIGRGRTGLLRHRRTVLLRHRRTGLLRHRRTGLLRHGRTGLLRHLPIRMLIMSRAPQDSLAAP
eukprot:6214564-Pleurochrysis_carterae.AAC.7